MLKRYQIIRGKKVSGRHPQEVYRDTRKHQNHCLAPTRTMVLEYLQDPSPKAWKLYERDYLKLLQQWFDRNPSQFDELAGKALRTDVYIGCSCPTKTNPDVYKCHTVLALEFMKSNYPALEIELPEPTV